MLKVFRKGTLEYLGYESGPKERGKCEEMKHKESVSCRHRECVRTQRECGECMREELLCWFGKVRQVEFQEGVRMMVLV